MEEERPNISRVKVSVRIRPLLQREILNNDTECVKALSDDTLMVGNREYKFDRVFEQSSSQEDIYTAQCRDLISGCFEGYNATLLAYGQTGSGKTYTMGTSGTYGLGLIPQVIGDIFSHVDQHSAKRNIIVKASFIEIYNESIYDLLSPFVDRTKVGLGIRQNKDKSISVCGAVEERTLTRNDMMNLLSRGNLKRSTSSTCMNDVSSRSHAIFTIWIEQHPKGEEVTEQEEIRAKFHFVDLAGSERLKKTGATGETMNQGININMGLLHLGDVINALTDPKEKFVPYRNSKLTRILQDSLGGNSNTEMIACVSPSSNSFEETVNTLKYASRAMNIKNKPVVNRDPIATLIQDQKAKILQLQSVIKGYQSGNWEGLETKLGRQQRDDCKYQRMMDQYSGKVDMLESTVKSQNSKLNQLQIQNLTNKRERDLYKLYVQQNCNAASVDFKDIDTSVIDEHTARNALLQTQLSQKEADNSRLQRQLVEIMRYSKRDVEILLAKLRQLEYLKRELSCIQRASKMKPRENEFSDSRFSSQAEDSINEQLQDEQVEEQRDQLSEFQADAHYQLGQVQEYISHREGLLKDLTDSQIVLEHQLIQTLKEQYAIRIRGLENEKEILEKDIMSARSKENSTNTVQALRVKKERLEQKLREYVKKQKEQEQLERMVNTQKDKIGVLKDELGKFKSQRVELNRRLREQHQKFEKLKQSKAKDILMLNKKGAIRDREINKLNRINHKKDMIILKKNQQGQRLKKAHEILMNVVRNKPMSKRDRNQRKNNANRVEAVPEYTDFSAIIDDVFQQLTVSIDIKQSVSKLQEELKVIHDQIYRQTNRYSMVKLQFQRLSAGESEELQDVAQLLIDLDEQLDVLHQRKEYTKERYEKEMKSQYKEFDLERDVVFNPKYTDINQFRMMLMETLVRSQRLLCQRISQIHRINELTLTMSGLEENTTELRQQLLQLKEQHQQDLNGLREQIVMRNNQNIQRNINRPDDSRRQLNNNNKKIKQLTLQNGNLRKKYEVMTEKYEVAKKLGNKDKYIGLNNRSLSTQKIATFKERRLQRHNHNNSLDKINIYDQPRFSNTLPFFHNNTEAEGDHDEEIEEQSQWECTVSLVAHQSGVLHIAMADRMIVSTATKSAKIWDAITLKCLYQIGSLNGFVRTAVISATHNTIATACDKTINLWDTRTFKGVGTLKGHEQAIRCLELDNFKIYSGAKGTTNSGGVIIWDIRNGRMFDEKQRNQDVFSMVVHNDVLYYGTRNHLIKKMKTDTLEISSFNIPHFDTVTCLATSGQYLISGSKDKNLRLWNIQDSKDNYKYTMYAHKDYINVLSVDNESSLIFSGSRDGQVKVSTICKDKIQVLGCIDCHSSSVSGLLAHNSTLMTCSSDTTIRVWRNSKQAQQYL